jgi:hypothetical protein
VKKYKSIVDNVQDLMQDKTPPSKEKLFIFLDTLINVHNEHLAIPGLLDERRNILDKILQHLHKIKTTLETDENILLYTLALMHIIPTATEKQKAQITQALDERWLKEIASEAKKIAALEMTLESCMK